MTEVSEWSRGDWMQTFTGKAFYPNGPTIEDIDPRDICHALSQICRYGGHTNSFYSVAEHSLLLSYWFEETTGNLELSRWALLHDAAEAYIGDMIRPIKRSMPSFQAIEDHLLILISALFGLETSTIPDEVKDADTRILLDERAVLLSSPPQDWAVEHLEPLGVEIRCLSPVQAEKRWATRCFDLFGYLEATI